MRITQRILKTLINETNDVINALNEESEKLPQMKHHNDRSIIRLKGKRDGLESILHLLKTK